MVFVLTWRTVIGSFTMRRDVPREQKQQVVGKMGQLVKEFRACPSAAFAFRLIKGCCLSAI